MQAGLYVIRCRGGCRNRSLITCGTLKGEDFLSKEPITEKVKLTKINLNSYYKLKELKIRKESKNKYLVTDGERIIHCSEELIKFIGILKEICPLIPTKFIKKMNPQTKKRIIFLLNYLLNIKFLHPVENERNKLEKN